MSQLSRLAWLASRIIWSDCTKRLFAKQTNIGVTLSYGLMTETPSLCNHHCWHAKPASLPHTMSFTFSLLIHPPPGDFFFLSLPVQHLAIVWAEASLSPGGLGSKWTYRAGTHHPWTSLEHFEGSLVPLRASNSIISLAHLTSFWIPMGSPAFFSGLLHVL